MGFMDEYNALKKKRKEEEKDYSESAFLERYNELKAQRPVDLDGIYYEDNISPENNLRIPYQSLDQYDNPLSKAVAGYGNVLAAIVNNSKPVDTSDRSWFESGPFLDGYDLFDVSKAIIGTAADVKDDVVEGIVGMAEPTMDAILYGGSFLLDKAGSLIFGKKNWNDQWALDRAMNGKGFFTSENGDSSFQQSLSEVISNDMINEESVTKVLGFDALKAFGRDHEDYSVLGDKSDSLVQSGGQLATTYGLNALGIPWFVTSGITSFGSELENAVKQGASLDEAGTSAAFAAASEIIAEKIFDGFSFGGKTISDVTLKPLIDKISNKAVRTLFKFGVDIAGEGVEDVLSGYGSAIGQKLTYADEKDLNELFSKEDRLDAFIGGIIMSLGVNSLALGKSIKNGVDYVSGMTADEEAVVNKETENRISALEEDGTELKASEKRNIKELVKSFLDKGSISTDTIEEVLGGETYKTYKDTVDSEDAQIKQLEDQIKELGDAPNTVGNSKKFDALQQQLDELKNNSKRTQLKSQLSEEVFSRVKNSRLVESYNENGRRSRAYQADLTKYDEKQQATIQRAIDSGILNNTNRTHEFVDMVAKVSADKGVLFDFTNNEKLKDSVFAVEGKTVNGYFDKQNGTVGVNIDSAKALNTVVGHEITHVLEGTELYDAMKETLFEYAKSKGDYQSRYDALVELYKDADIEAELAADLVGDYLFTDADFINHLSTKNRNVFQKIYDELLYLYKIATAGSKEARELEKVKKAFEKAYKEGGKATSDTKYSLAMVDEIVPKSDKWSRTHTTEEAMARFPNMWNVAADESEVRNPTQITSTVNSYRKIYNFLQNEGFNGTILDASSGLGYGTRAGIEEYGFNVEDIEPYPDKGYKPKYQDYSTLDKKYDVIISNAVLNVLPQDQRDALAIKMGEMLNDGGRLFVNVRGKDVESLAKTGKNIHLGNMEWIETVKGSYQKGFTKPELVAYLQDALGDGFTVKPTNMFGAVSAVVTKDGVKYSLSDSDGKQLTKEQQEYFKDSKMRDENGNLKVMYHGSQNAGFHVFDARMSDDDTSFFFVDRNDVASSYSGTSETYEAKTIRSAEDMNNFLAEIGYDQYEAVEKNGKFELLENGDHVAWSDTAQGIYEEFCWYEGVGEGDANYKVYLNLTNPLEVDAKGKNWNNISREFSQEIADRYHSLTAEEKAALQDLTEWGEYGIFKDEMLEARAGGNSILASAYEKLGGANANLYDAFSIASENFSEDAINQFAVKQMNTRDYAKKAKAEGYDGVIFNNIVDNGGYSNGSEGAATVAIAFDSNQIKSTANANPTGDADIRYSLSDNEKINRVTEDGLTMTYVRVPNQNTQNYGSTYGQNIEPAGEYMNMDTMQGKHKIDGYEYGTIQFKKPLVLEHINTSDTGWKKTVSDMYNGLTGKKLTEALIKDGYDAIVTYDDYGYNEIVNLNGKKLSDQGVRFSLSESVEETKDLMAIHNLTGEKLLKSLKLGGLPMPSVAIAKAKDGHGEFGEISLILPKETIDPDASSKNKLYSGDAWTPTYPSVEYKPNKDALLAIEEKIDSLVPYEVRHELGSLMFDTDNARDYLNRYGGNMVEAYKQNDAMKYAYLKDTGSDIFLPTKKANLYLYGGHSNEAVRYFSGKLVNGLQTVEQYRNTNSRELLQDKDLTEAVADAQNFDVLRTLEPGSNEYLEYESNPAFRADEVSLRDVLNFLDAAKKLFTNGEQQTVDRKAAKELIRSEVDQTAYETWLKNLFDGVVEKEGIRNNKDFYTPSGNRRSFEALHYEHNLENVIKAMREQGEKGIGNGFGGASIFGASTTEFSSIEDMKRSSDRLQMMSYDEYQELRKQFTDRFLDIAIRLPNTKNSFSATDSAAEVLTEAVAKYKTRSGIANYLRRELKGWATYSDQVVDDLIDLVNDIRKMPTGYFEAKPQRAVGFDEVGVFVIPRNADVKLKQELLNRGYSIAEYDPDVEGDRQKVVNQFEEYKFSLSNVGEETKTYGNYNVSGKDIALESGPVAEDVAPVQETVSKMETVAPVAEETELFPDTPLAQSAVAELDKLNQQKEALEARMLEAVGAEDYDTFNQLNAEYTALMQELEALDQEVAAEDADRINSLTEADIPPEMDAPYYGDNQTNQVDDPFEDRDWYEVGNRKVKAYMYENPEVKTFFQEEAMKLLGELNDTTRGERWYNDQLYYESGGGAGFGGVKRHTSASMEELLDSWGMSYADIEKGLNAIIEDHGAENIAAAKKLEFMLNDRLLNGYKDFYTNSQIPPNQDYINLLNEKQITEYSKESFDALMANADQIAPPVADESAAFSGGDVAPVLGSKIKAVDPHQSVGAAPYGFDPVTQLQYEYGTIPEGEHPVRDDSLPKSTNGKDKVSLTARTVKGAEATPDGLVDLLDKETVGGRFSYIPIKNSDTVKKAYNDIVKKGWEAARGEWEAKVRNGEVSAEMTATGALLLNNAAKAGDRTVWLSVLHDYQIMGTNAGQAVQAMRILKTLTPDDSLYMIERSVEQMVEDMKLGTEIVIDENLKQAYLDAKTDGDRDAARKALAEDVAKQIPSTAMDKWTALRYLNMLGNLRTQGRNIIGNLGMSVTSGVKNTVATTIEAVAEFASGGKFHRTKSLFVSKDLLKAARNDFANVESVALNGGKFNDPNAKSIQFQQEVQDSRKIFKFAPLEMYRRATNFAMDKGDLVFSKAAYGRALAGYLKANGITETDFSKIDQKTLDDARAYAVEQAQEQTFRDNNWLSNWVSKIGRRKDTPKIGKLVSEGVMPFRKTPANILLRAEEYSPLGLVNSTVKSIQAIKGTRNVTGADVVNSWAKTLTGTGLFALGMLLNNSGALSGGPDEDDDKEWFEDQYGWQNYSIHIGDHNFTIDFLSPAAMPLLMGAQLNELRQNDGIELKDLETALLSIADPMIEMSMLQGVNDTLENIRYSENNMGQFLVNAGLSYLTQGLTNSFLGQLERSFEGQRMSTYVDKDSDIPAWLQKALGKASAKIPGWDYQQIPYVNAWGETEDIAPLPALAENTLSPSYISQGITDDVYEELNRLNDAQSDINVYPQTPDKTVTFYDADGKLHEDYNLSAEEYVELAELQGSTQKELVEEILSSDQYSELTNREKARAVQLAYQYAREYSRQEVLDADGFSAKWMEKAGDDIVNAIIAHTNDERTFAYDYPEKYKFFEKSGIGYDAYASADEDGKRAYNWAYENPGKYTMSKAIANDFLTYYGYKQEISAIKKNHVGDGEKDVVTDYINNMDLDYGQKIILYRSMYESKQDKANYNMDIIDYLNGRDDISYSEMETILTELGFKVSSDGTITWD